MSAREGQEKTCCSESCAAPSSPRKIETPYLPPSPEAHTVIAVLETGQCTCCDFFVNSFGSKCTATLELRRCEWAAYVMHTHKPACPTDGSKSRTDCSGWPLRSHEHQASQMACPITHRICTRMERAHDVPGTCTDQQCRLAVMFSGMYGSTHKETALAGHASQRQWCGSLFLGSKRPSVGQSGHQMQCSHQEGPTNRKTSSRDQSSLGTCPAARKSGAEKQTSEKTTSTHESQ